MIWRLLNPQGIAGLAASLVLGILLLVQKGEANHWKRQSASFQQLYLAEQSAFAGTVERYRAAADAARAADQANTNRVAAEQRSINERTGNDFEVRLAAARARAERLRIQAAADPRSGRSSSMPGLSAPASGAAQGTRKDRLPAEDALTATEQAIQLDELIKWVRQQAKVDNSAPAVATPHGN